MGNPLQIVDQNSVMQSYAYDGFGRIAAVSRGGTKTRLPMIGLATFFEMTAFEMAPWRSLQERTG